MQKHISKYMVKCRGKTPYIEKLKIPAKNAKKGLQFLRSCGIIFKQSGITPRQAKRIVGVDYDGGPPVPIPNTEVKPARAENTWLETAREDRFSPTLKDGFHLEAVFLLFNAELE